MSKDKGLKSVDQLKALRERKYSAPTGPQAEAVRREASFLKNLTGAQADYQWIVQNEAWKHLGHDTYTSWFVARVRPMLEAFGGRPTPEVAADIMDRVPVDEQALPPAQRRSQREIASLAGVSERTVRRRSQDQDTRSVSARGDLDATPTTTDAPPAPDAPVAGEPLSATSTSVGGTPTTAGPDPLRSSPVRPSPPTSPPADVPSNDQVALVADHRQPGLNPPEGDASAPTGDGAVEHPNAPVQPSPQPRLTGDGRDRTPAWVAGSGPTQLPDWLTAVDAYITAAERLDEVHPHTVGRAARGAVAAVRKAHDRVTDWLTYAEHPDGT